jgi:hypothetical protein
MYLLLLACGMLAEKFAGAQIRRAGIFFICRNTIVQWIPLFNFGAHVKWYFGAIRSRHPDTSGRIVIYFRLGFLTLAISTEKAFLIYLCRHGPALKVKEKPILPFIVPEDRKGC